MAPSDMTIQTPLGPLALGRRTRIVAILNVTPDSFSDAGQHLDPDSAIQHGLRMIAEGADILDIGGESTRPGSAPTPSDEQIRRTIPVITGLRAAGATLPISIDTQSAAVAAAALTAGASIVNDISALRHDPDMPALCARTRAAVILMQMQGTPQTMHLAPTYTDVVAEVAAFLTDRANFAAAAGIPRDRLILDPGIGFGKTYDHNLSILRNLRAFTALGLPILIGPSRKAFLGAITHESSPAARDPATAAAVAHCCAAGIHLVRIHNVRMMRQVAEVLAAITAP